MTNEERKKYIELLIPRLIQMGKIKEKDSAMQSNYTDLKKLLWVHLEKIDDDDYVSNIIAKYLKGD